MRVVWVLRGFVLLLPVAALAACTGSSATPNLSPVSSAPRSAVASSAGASPSASVGYPADVPLTGHNVRPGEKPPVYPAAARVHSQAGANAFAEFFMRTLDWAYATTNPSYMKHYYGPTCGQCSGLATGIAKTSAETNWYLGGRLTVHPAVPTSIAPVTAPADYCSLVVVDISATSVVDEQGHVLNGDRAYQGDHFKLCAKQAGKPEWMATYLARIS
jgi:hypothetical protein